MLSVITSGLCCAMYKGRFFFSFSAATDSLNPIDAVWQRLETHGRICLMAKLEKPIPEHSDQCVRALPGNVWAKAASRWIAALNSAKREGRASRRVSMPSSKAMSSVCGSESDASVQHDSETRSVRAAAGVTAVQLPAEATVCTVCISCVLKLQALQEMPCFTPDRPHL